MVLLLLLFTAIGALMLPGKARAASIDVGDNRAEVDFPNDITFFLSARSDVNIVRVELLYQIADEETLNGILPDLSPSNAVQLSVPLDLRLNYQPPGVDIAYRWRLTDANGMVTETQPKTVLWEDDRFDWEMIQNEQVTVYAYNGDPDFNRTILNSAQETIDELQTRFSVERGRPLRIWVYDSGEDFGSSLPANSETWIAGAAYPELGLILAVLPPGNLDEVGRVVPHEVSHQLLSQATENPFNWPPPWLDEGLAGYSQEGGTEEFPSIVERAAREDRLLSIRALNSTFPYDPAEARLAYAESLDIIRFVIEEFGEEKLSQLVDVYSQGVSHEEAVQQVFGFSLDELDRRWKESIRSRDGSNGQVPGDLLGRPAADARAPVADGLASGALVTGTAVLLAMFGFLLIGRHRHTRSLSDASDAEDPW